MTVDFSEGGSAFEVQLVAIHPQEERKAVEIEAIQDPTTPIANRLKHATMYFYLHMYWDIIEDISQNVLYANGYVEVRIKHYHSYVSDIIREACDYRKNKESELHKFIVWSSTSHSSE